MSEANPFDYIKSIMTNKRNLMRGSNNDKMAEKEYSPVLTMRALMLHKSLVYFANEMNMMYQISNRAQYEYLLNTIRKGQYPYKKWPKNASAKKKDNELNLLICNVYKVNKYVANSYLKLLSDEQIAIIKKQQEKGGSSKNNGKTNKNIR